MKHNSGSFGFKDTLYHLLARARGIGIETDPNIYRNYILSIKKFDFSGIADSGLALRMQEARSEFDSGSDSDDVLCVVFALVYEAARRSLGIDAFDEQLQAGIALVKGKLVEMQTGEGKTLAIVFAACMAACSGNRVHVLTANDYLASRDAVWMGKVYSMLGVSVTSVTSGMESLSKKKAYEADVVYVTAKEAGFDYLRDGICTNPLDIVHRGFDFAIVDEADFLLIDESRIPLVIAKALDRSSVDPAIIDRAVKRLVAGSDFLTDKNARKVFLTIGGEKKIGSMLGCEGMHEESSMPVYAAVTVSLYARELLSRDKDYIVRGCKVELVDELTGRVAGERRWPYGIQAAIAAKEGLGIEIEGKVCGTITIRHLMSLYAKISALTATAVSAATEFSRSYGLDVVVIPQHRKCIRTDEPDVVFATRNAKMCSLVHEIVQVRETGRPVLIGTKSVSESEELASMLAVRNVKCEILNAKNDAEEARLVSRAGTFGAVTVSTNMAGRGTDIRLGGDNAERREDIEALGGLYVIGTNRHESVRTDNQLRGRAGRQGDPGTSRFFVSLEDELFVKYGIREFIPEKFLGSNSDEPVSDREVQREIDRAQAIIEDQHFEIRRQLYRYSEITERQRKYVGFFRDSALAEREVPDEIRSGTTRKIGELASTCTAEKASEALCMLFMDTLDRFWVAHLAFLDDLKEGIHLRRLAGKEPLLEYIRESDIAFQSGLDEVFSDTIGTFVGMTGDEISDYAGKRSAFGPAATWTYTVSDDPFPGFNAGMFAGKVLFAIVAGIIRYLFVFPRDVLVSIFRKKGGRKAE